MDLSFNGLGHQTSNLIIGVRVPVDPQCLFSIDGPMQLTVNQQILGSNPRADAKENSNACIPFEPLLDKNKGLKIVY